MANETTIDSLNIELNYSAGQASLGVDTLTISLQKLQNITKSGISGLTTVKNQLEKFVVASSGLNTIDLSKFSTSLSDISSSVKPLTNLGKTNLGSFINQLKKIPDLDKSLDSETISKFSKKIKDLSDAMLPLANNITKVGNVLNNLPSKLNKVSNYTKQTTNSMSNLGSISKLLNFGVLLNIGTRLGTAIGGFIAKSNEYVEDMNLFNVAMGESTEKAKEFIDTTSEALGLDPAPMMRYMGVFQMISSGFGLSADNAYKMSKNLTQLTYDIASFYNLNIDEAAQKVQSAISGELEPVRRLGYALDQATLKQIALNNGITESITTMTQAEKAQLRYIALLTQNQAVQGDMRKNHRR